MRLTPGKQVGIGTSNPQAKLDVRVAGGAQQAMHISSDGADAGDIPALRWRNASGDDKLAINIKVQGDNTHHMIEACFKGVGRTLRQAFRITDTELPSTKGTL